MNWTIQYSLSILPQLIYRYNVIPLKIQARFLIDIKIFILKFIWEGKGTRIAKTILKKDKFGGNQSRQGNIGKRIVTLINGTA